MPDQKKIVISSIPDSNGILKTFIASEENLKSIYEKVKATGEDPDKITVSGFPMAVPEYNKINADDDITVTKAKAEAQIKASSEIIKVDVGSKVVEFTCIYTSYEESKMITLDIEW